MSSDRPVVRLPCCEAGGEVVRLLYVGGAFSSHDSTDAFMGYVRATPPQWVILFKKISGLVDVAAVSFCPFCGARVPGVRRRAELPPRVMVIVDGGYYCDTCGERLDACDCPSPETMWEATA